MDERNDTANDRQSRSQPAEESPDPWDPWTDTRPAAMRAAERARRFAPINAAWAAAQREEKQLQRMALTRWDREGLTPGELLDEIEYLEQRLAVIGDYPATRRRQDALAYYEKEVMTATYQLARLNRAGVRRTEPPASDFARIKYVDLVGLAQSLLGTEGRKAGDRWVFPCFLHEDWEPSLVVYPPGGGWYCFQCNHGGQDAASFVAEYFSTTMVEGLRFVLEMCDVPE